MTPLYFFSSNLVILWTERPYQSEPLNGWVKIHQIPHAVFETKSKFFLSLFSGMRDNSSVPFRLKLNIIWTKGAH